MVEFFGQIMVQMKIATLVDRVFLASEIFSTYISSKRHVHSMMIDFHQGPGGPGSFNTFFHLQSFSENSVLQHVNI